MWNLHPSVAAPSTLRLPPDRACWQLLTWKEAAISCINGVFVCKGSTILRPEWKAITAALSLGHRKRRISVKPLIVDQISVRKIELLVITFHFSETKDNDGPLSAWPSSFLSLYSSLVRLTAWRNSKSNLGVQGDPCLCYCRCCFIFNLRPRISLFFAITGKRETSDTESPFEIFTVLRLCDPFYDPKSDTWSGDNGKTLLQSLSVIVIFCPVSESHFNGWQQKLTTTELLKCYWCCVMSLGDDTLKWSHHRPAVVVLFYPHNLYLWPPTSPLPSFLSSPSALQIFVFDRFLCQHRWHQNENNILLPS